MPPATISMADQLPGVAFVTGVKLAVMVCGEFNWKETGFAELKVLPDQFTNRYPVAAVAVSVAAPPASTQPSPMTVPAPVGLTSTLV